MVVGCWMTEDFKEFEMVNQIRTNFEFRASKNEFRQTKEK